MADTLEMSGSIPDAAAKRPNALGRLAVLAGLTSVAVAQPVLDLFGESPSTFQVNRVGSRATLAFGIGVVVLPPLLLWLIGEILGRIDRRAGRIAHLAMVGLLGAAFGVLTVKELTDATALHALTGLATAALLVWGMARNDAVATACRYLGIANLGFLALFVFVAPVADWISGDIQPLPEYAVDLTGAAPPVIMLVFDEWPTQTLLGDDEHIDPVRFPNMAAFADDATWYRHFTTVSPFTQSAVPALLDGRDPQGEPTWQDHPDSLFTLLAPSHHLTVAESITSLCGLPGCGVRPVAPPLAEETVDTTEPRADATTGSRWGVLLGDATDLWWQRVTPGTQSGPAAFDDFEEEFVPVETTTSTTTAADPDAIALERFLNALVEAQPNRQQLFLDALQPTDEPFFAFLHLILPHQPWLRREDGTEYEVAANRRDFEADNDADWPTRVGRQRHFLQAEYSDRLLGQVLERLREIDAYDESLIVVVGDHGAGFVPGEPSRRIEDDNLEQITYSPLLIKAPGQTLGVIDDTNVNSTDVAPTVADLLGIEVPWAIDGASAGSPAIERRGDSKYVHNFSDAFTYEFLGVIEYEDATSYADLLDGRYPMIGLDDDRVGALYAELPGAELIGASAADTIEAVDGPATARVDALADLQRPGDGPLLGELAGHLELGEVSDVADSVVVAVNGTIVGLSPLYERAGVANSFVVLLPADALSEDTNDIVIGLRRADGSVAEATVVAN